MRILVGFGLALGLAACEPLYGGPSEHLHAPPVKLHGNTTVATDPLPYNETCTVDFQRDARNVHRQPTAAATLARTGGASLETAERAPTPVAKASLTVTAIDSYRNALLADPYDAEATLGLAVAYDRVLHKGCALAMLRRLESLTANPTLADAATRKIDDVVDNTQWFSGYRRDALAAVNH